MLASSTHRCNICLVRCVISYKYSGASPKRLNRLLGSVADALEENGQDYFCLHFTREQIIKEAGQYAEHIMLKRAMSEIDTCDYLLVIYDQQEKSAGMLMEIGYALAKNKPVYMLYNNSIDTGYVKDMLNRSWAYNDIDKLKTAVNNFVAKLINQSVAVV